MGHVVQPERKKRHRTRHSCANESEVPCWERVNVELRWGVLRVHEVKFDDCHVQEANGGNNSYHRNINENVEKRAPDARGCEERLPRAACGPTEEAKSYQWNYEAAVEQREGVAHQPDIASRGAAEDASCR